MKYEKQTYMDVAKLPIQISKALARGIGRIVVEQLNAFFYGEEDLSTEEWRRFEDESIEVDPYTTGENRWDDMGWSDEE